MLKLTLVVGKIHLFIAAGLRSCFLLAVSQGCFFSTCNGTLYSVRQFASSRAAGEHFWPQGRLCPLLKGFQLIMSCSPKIVYLLINLKTADFWNSITSVKCLHPAIYHKLITGVTSIIFAIYCNQWWEVMGVTVLFLQETFFGPLCLLSCLARFMKHFIYVSASHTGTWAHQRQGGHFISVFQGLECRGSINTCPTELETINGSLSSWPGMVNT